MKKDDNMEIILETISMESLRELARYLDTGFKDIKTQLQYPWTKEGRIELKGLISFLKEQTGEIVSYESAEIIREMFENDYEERHRYDPGDMVKVTTGDMVTTNSDIRYVPRGDMRYVPRPLLYEWVDVLVNRWRRRRGYMVRVDGVDMLRGLVKDEYGVQAGSLEELRAMLFVVGTLW